MDIEAGHTLPEVLDRFSLSRCGGWQLIKRRARSGQFLALGTVSQQSVVANAHKARRQHMQQEAADEFLGIQRHHLALVAVGVVLVAKAHLGTLVPPDTLMR